MIFVDEITTYLALNNKEIEEFELASMSKERHPQKDTKDSDEMQLNLNKNL